MRHTGNSPSLASAQGDGVAFVAEKAEKIVAFSLISFGGGDVSSSDNLVTNGLEPAIPRPACRSFLYEICRVTRRPLSWDSFPKRRRVNPGSRLRRMPPARFRTWGLLPSPQSRAVPALPYDRRESGNVSGTPTARGPGSAEVRGEMLSSTFFDKCEVVSNVELTGESLGSRASNGAPLHI